MKSNHTSGSWTSHKPIQSSDIEPAWAEVNRDQAVIARCYYGKTDDERLANAQLMAESPNLLNTLKELVEAANSLAESYSTEKKEIVQICIDNSIDVIWRAERPIDSGRS